MKIVVPGGSGHVGQIVRRHFRSPEWEVVVISRGNGDFRWDGETQGPWAEALDGADVVLNLAGRSVNCRYTPDHLREMMESRVRSTRVVGEAIAQAKRPPRVWLQASTATIYAHRFDAANDERSGRIGGGEPGVPALWDKSVAIAQAWEAELEAAPTPHTRKVALRSAITMSPDGGSAFDVLANLARRGLGGTVSDGRQWVSWIHEDDFAEALKFVINREDLSGPVNVCAPHPLPNAEFNRALRQAVGAPFGIPTPRWALEIGAALMGTETELVLKSRRVVPIRLLEAGYTFRYPEWPEAARELAERWRGE